jgi:hypothetical protein
MLQSLFVTTTKETCRMRRLIWLFLLLFCTNLLAQDVVRGTREIEFFAQGGHSVAGGRGDTSVFNAGLRVGFALFNLGPGSVEHELEAIPVYYFAQPGKNAYGVSFTPFDIKYNFTRNSTHPMPFMEIGGGVLFTNNDVPFGTNKVNFTPQAGVGVHLPFGNHGWHATLAVKYVHVSNAGLSVPNPGVNSVQVRLGFGKFKKH